jgi:hypothetical protein
MSDTVKTRSIKEDVIRMIERLPDNCTFQDIQYHLHLREQVEAAMKDVDEGRVHSQEEVERMMAEWLKSSGPSEQPGNCGKS